MERNIQILWFKRDLRVEDNWALAAAAMAGPVLPLYIAEPAFWALPDSSARQWAFVRNCLEGLRADLADLGCPLIVRTGDAVDILEGLFAEYDVHGLWSHEETGGDWTFKRDQRVADWCRAKGLIWHEVQAAGVIRRLKTRDRWAQAWDAYNAQPQKVPPKLAPVDAEPGPLPTDAALGLAPDICPARQDGGRQAAQELLHTFLTHRGRAYQRGMSSPVTGADACSRLSPHLAWGTLSSREAAQACWARQAEKEHGWAGALRAFNARLHWRCHFMQKLEDEPRLEWQNLHPAYDDVRPTSPDAPRLDAWSKGETGLPFVDATMRCLNATGWMNFRMRAMLVSVASYHLWLPWQASGTQLARKFTDYEPGIHWPQVQMQSGTTGINTIRIYNPVKQGHDQDPDGRFIRRWVPELAPVPDAHIHEPWLWSEAGTVLGRTYPDPIIDPKAAARTAREKIWAVRKSSGHRQTAQKIVAKHASRKRPRRPRRPDPSAQTQFDF